MTLCGCNRLTLTTCRRSNGELFAWYSSLIRGGARFELPLSAVLAEARARFTLAGPADHNLCISHRRRHQLNKAANERERLAHPAQLVRARQSFWAWPGQKLLGAAGSRTIRNGCTYTVEAVGTDFLALVGEGKVPFAQTGCLRLATAQTYASCQGTEFSGSLALWDCDSRHFTMRHLFVALSRATVACNIVVK
jgi:hypothetical protein